MSARALGVVFGAVLGLTFMVPVRTRAQDVPELVPKDVFTSSTLEIGTRSPSLSPDGRWIAFTGRPSPDRSSIYVIPAEGGTDDDLVQVTRGAFSDGNPSWSPDGRFLYFFSDRVSAGSGLVHPMRVPFDPQSGRSAGLARPLSLEEAYPVSALAISPVDAKMAVSPDGRWVAYAVRGPVSGSDVGIRVLPASGGAARELARTGFVAAAGLGWSPDSRFVLWDEWVPRQDREGGLHRVALDGGGPEQAVPFETTLYGISGDGRRLMRFNNGASTPGPSFVVMDPSGDSILTFSIPKQASAPNGPGFDGTSFVALGEVDEASIEVVPVNAGPPTNLLQSSRMLDVIGWTGGDRLLVDEYQGIPRFHAASLMNAQDGTVEDISEPLRAMLEHGYMYAIHPDGRHVLGQVSEGSREAGNYRTSVVIVDLVSRTVQQLSNRASTALIDIRGHDDGYAGDVYVFGDRFIYPDVEGGRIRLMSVAPGSDPELFWTLPSELVEPLGDGLTGLRAQPIAIHETSVAWVRIVANGADSTATRSTLLVTDVSTGRSREIGSVAGRLTNPTWARSGKRVALQYEPPSGKQATLAVFDLDGDGGNAGTRLILDTGMKERAWLKGWSADDQALVFHGMGGLSLTDDSYYRIPVRAGAVPTNLTPGNAKWYEGILSPDGSRLAYSARRVIGSRIVRYDLPDGSRRD